MYHPRLLALTELCLVAGFRWFMFFFFLKHVFIHVHVDVHPSKRDNTHWPAVSWVDVNQPFPALLLGKRYCSKKKLMLGRQNPDLPQIF